MPLLLLRGSSCGGSSELETQKSQTDNIPINKGFTGLVFLDYIQDGKIENSTVATRSMFLFLLNLGLIRSLTQGGIQGCHGGWKRGGYR